MATTIAGEGVVVTTIAGEGVVVTTVSDSPRQVFCLPIKHLVQIQNVGGLCPCEPLMDNAADYLTVSVIKMVLSSGWPSLGLQTASGEGTQETVLRK